MHDLGRAPADLDGSWARSRGGRAHAAARGRPLLVRPPKTGEAVRALTRLTVDGDRSARLENYFYTSELIADVCGELGVPFRVNGHR